RRRLSAPLIGQFLLAPQGLFGLEDGFASSQGLIDHGVETPRIFSNSPSYIIPMIFCNQTTYENSASMMDIRVNSLAMQNIVVIPSCLPSFICWTSAYW